MCTCINGGCALSSVCKNGENIIALQNIRSLLPKIEQVRWFLKEHPIDFLCLNETWLNNSIDDAEILIDGYNIIRKDRNNLSTQKPRNTKKPVGGGVLIYVKETYSYKIRNDLVTDDIECLWIEVKLAGISPFLVGTFYRPPSVNKEYNEKIKTNIERAGLDNKQMYITGDFNIDYNNKVSNLITEIEELHGLTQIVKFPTRVTPSSSTSIDLILTTNPELHKNTEPLKIGWSDHYMVFTVIDFKTKNKNANHHKYATFRSYKKFNEHLFIAEIKQSFPHLETDHCSVNESWHKWKDKFLQICDKHAPLRHMRVKNRNNPWIDNDVLEKMYERDHKHRKAVSSKDNELWNQYKCLRNEVTALIRQKKKEYYVSKLETSKTSKEMWSVMNSIVPNKKKSNTIPPEMNANKFNKYFAEIGITLANKHKDVKLQWKNPEYTNSFKFKNPTRKFILKKLIKLPNKSNLDILLIIYVIPYAI
jgi:hypothetical protein